MRKPKHNSYTYVLRFLNCKNSAPAKAFIKWLEEHKLLFWLKDAEKLIYWTTVYLTKPMLLEFIPQTVQEGLRKELLYHLQQLKNYNLHLKLKRQAYKRRLDEALEQILPQELEFLQEAYKYNFKFKYNLGVPRTECAELDEYLTLTDFAAFEKLEQVNEWLEKDPIERTAIINRIMYLQGLLKLKLQAKEAEQERRRKEEERQQAKEWSETFNRYGGYSKGYYSGDAFGRFSDELRRYASRLSDCFTKLGLASNATKADVKKAFRSIALIHHPDKCGGDDEKFKEINNAYEEAMRIAQ